MAYTVINRKLAKVGRNGALLKPLNKPLAALRHIRTIEVGGKYYGFFHCNDDDARYLHDEDGDLILTIDANLNVTARDGRFGSIESDANWTLYYGPIRTRFDTGVAIRDHHWQALEDAEIEVCKFYIQNTLLPKFKRPQETEGGSHD